MKRCEFRWGQTQRHRGNDRLLCVGMIACVAMPTLVQARTEPEWNVVFLDPHQNGAAYAASGSQQVGTLWENPSSGGTISYAYLWNSTFESITYLDGSASGSGFYLWAEALGAAGDQQVGFFGFDNGHIGGGDQPDHACLWRGTFGSRIDLHPIDFWLSSSAVATDGSQQGGYIVPTGSVHHAGIWRGTAASWIDLHPAGATSSEVKCVDANQQGGFAIIGGVTQAGIWSGSAPSWVSFHTTGLASSTISGMSSGQQVGSVRYVGGNGGTAAVMWTGTAASRISLHSAELWRSQALATNGVHQVGCTIERDDTQKACMWSGTSASRFDLSALLPPGFSSSCATDVSKDGIYTYITGWAQRTVPYTRRQAVLWKHLDVPPCEADFNNDQVVDIFDYLDFLQAFDSGC